MAKGLLQMKQRFVYIFSTNFLPPVPSDTFMNIKWVFTKQKHPTEFMEPNEQLLFKHDHVQ